ncbi:ligase-associated DNA damage response DEXH box helicase [Aquabacter sp. CN5-332]|uniref:ligase-associated DNA damage response DEXH box helicase n=1 Tax=Aquabacter sp. CN5-332 TaxID=3156608 RepID=UPI0032B49B47
MPVSKRELGAGAALPDIFLNWFAARGWAPRAHQLDLLAHARAGKSTLLIAPTGAGKTLAGFLPSLVELSEGRNPKRKPGAAGRAPPEKASPLHTLYISPLKALAVDIARNLETPISEMGLPIRVETRTGDTPSSRRQRQRRDPPDILLTTPEQMSLLLASKDAEYLFSGLRRVVLDELHALVTSKRGDLLALALARLRKIAPGLQTVGLSATVAEPDDLRRYLVGQNPEPPLPLHDVPPPPLRGRTGEGGETGVAWNPARGPSGEIPPSPALPRKGGGSKARGAGSDPGPLADLVIATGGAAPDLSMLETQVAMPWATHTALHALPEVYGLIKAHKMSLVFVNTRWQAEFLFQELWRINDDNLPIALHHGSLDVEQRRRVESAMAAGLLRAVVCTSSLDLGIDWGDVDQVINVGAPKGSSRLMQRIGRANHRLDESSHAVLVPANRFEVLECRAALEAVRAGAQDTPPERTGALDVLAQHVLGMACAEPFSSEALYNEVRSAAPYRHLSWEDFEQVVDFVATGGYALRAYERYAKIRRTKDGLWRVANPMVAQSYRLNVGTIVEATMIKVRLVSARGASKTGVAGRPRYGGKMLGEVEEYFVETMVPGDTFVFAGEILRYDVMVEDEIYVSRSTATEPKVPSYEGGKFPLSTFLAAGVRALLAAPERWKTLPRQVRDWLELQRARSRLPRRTDLLVETFARAGRFYLVCYPFEGRLAHQTLGMLLTRRLERARLKPLGFVANDYAIAVYAAGDMGAAVKDGRLSLDALFDADMLGDDLEAWLAESALMKRTFRTCAVIAGLIERRFPGKEKTKRQVTVSTDLVYDVLRRHEPGHVLLRAARADAATGLLDVRRLSDMLMRVKGHMVHQPLEHVSPLSVPVLLEIGRESVGSVETAEALLAEAEEDLVREAMG